MRDYNHGRFQQQIRFLRRQFHQDGDLPFSNLLSEKVVQKALTAVSFVGHLCAFKRPPQQATEALYVGVLFVAERASSCCAAWSNGSLRLCRRVTISGVR